MTLNAYITTKSITHFKASGASDIILENKLTAQNVKLDLSGATEFSGELNVTRLEAVIGNNSLSEASEIIKK